MQLEKKIMLCVDSDAETRKKMISKLAVQMGLAIIPSDSSKLIKSDIYDVDLENDYIILCDNVDLSGSDRILHALYRRAALGAPVIIGAKKMNKVAEFMCCVHYSSNLL